MTHNFVNFPFGVYRFNSVRKAFKNVYCQTCNAARMAVLVQTLNIVSLCGIPLVPYGFWSYWICSVCGHDPHIRTGTRRWLKKFASVFFGITSVFMMFGAVSLWNVDKQGTLTLSIVALVLMASSIALRISASRQEPDAVLKEKLRHVQPSQAKECRFCKEALLENPTWHCPKCLVERR